MGSDGGYTLALEGVGRWFGRRVVFSSVSTSVSSGQALVVAGANGSGKSTLLRIVAGLLGPSAGAVRLTARGIPVSPSDRRRLIGYVAPDLTLYRELTAAENLLFFGRLRGLELTREDLIRMLERVGLKGRGRDLVGGYSSGMRQRLKYAFALLHQPPILLLDEPTANLDQHGAAIVTQIVEEQKQAGLVVVATNEPAEVQWGDTVVRLTAA